MAKLPGNSYVIFISLIFFGYLAPIEVQCDQSAELIAQINGITRNPIYADDQQIEECFTAFCNGTSSDKVTVEEVAAVESLFDGVSLARLKKYFIVHPDRLNDKLLSKIASYGDKVVNSFAPIVAEHIENIKSSALMTFSQNRTTVKRLFIDALEKCNSLQSLISILALIMRESSDQTCELYHYGLKIIKKKLAVMVPNKGKALTLEYVLLLFMHKYVNGSLPPGCSISGQTAQHVISLTKQFDATKNGPKDYLFMGQAAIYLTEYVIHKHLKKVVDRIITLEQQFAKTGYYTFVHGQRWEYHLAEQWYTWLWEVEQNRSAGDYKFIHCRKLKKEKLEKQKKFRKQILEKGRIELKERKRLLFLNAPFFGNLKQAGSCTAYFAYANQNINDLKFSLVDIFRMFECSEVYAKYKNELEALENEHKLLSKRGQVVFLAIPKKIVKECVYIAQPGGYKRSIVIDGKPTADVEVILEALRTDATRIDDADHMEFCMTLTDDMLTPDTGIKVFSLPMADEAKIKAFDAKSRNLFERIKKELKLQLEKENKISRCVEQINLLLAKANDQNITSIKTKINREILAGISDHEKNLIKERLLSRNVELHEICAEFFDPHILSSRSGSFVAKVSFDDDNVLKAHNLLDGQSVTINHHFGYFKPRHAEESPNHRYLLFASLDKIIVLDRATNSVKEIADADKQNMVLFGISDKYFVVCNYSYPTSEISIYDLEKNVFVWKISTNYGIDRLLISDDNRYLVGADGKSCTTWDMKTRTLLNSLRAALTGESICLMRIKNKDCIVVSADGGRELRFVDMSTGLVIPEIPSFKVKEGYSIQHIAVSEDKTKMLYFIKNQSNTAEIHEKNFITGGEKVKKIRSNQLNDLQQIIAFDENHIIGSNNSHATDCYSLLKIWSYNDQANSINQFFS